MTQSECQALMACWNIGTIQSVAIPEIGTINTIRILDTDHGKFVLRIYRHHILKRIETELRVVRWVAERGIPAVLPLQTCDGKGFVEYNDQFVTLLPFVSGYQVLRDQLQLGDVAQMGRFLGQVHRVLSEYPIDDMPLVSVHIEPEETLAGIDRLEGLVRAVPNPHVTDEYALTRLISRREWLQGRGKEDVSGLFQLPFQVVHGDFQETNVFFENGEISALIDWDKIYTAPAVWEVIRTIHLMLHFEPTQSIAFLKAYQETNELSIEALDVAVHCYGLSRAYELWLFKEIYDHGNDRVRQFVRPGKFVPVADDWARVRPLVLEIL
jgi:Ser/Thr protein kinase RdoA (MazF antagonist)